MANCHDLFQTFDGNIDVSNSQREGLRRSRDAIRARIRAHFKDELDFLVPKFHGQGSYSMKTLIAPLDGGDYDVDDGVYLQHLSEDPATWPTAATVHKWLIDATTGYTKTDPEDRNRCVRVIYRGEPSSYHVDLPAYVLSDGVPLLFDKSREKASTPPVSPYESDPRAMTRWFDKQVDKNGQLRRLVRYLKAWKDYKRARGAGVAKGLTLTIITSESFQSDARDDQAFARTIDAIYARLTANISIRKPLAPFEDLTADWTPTQRDNFLDCLRQLRDRSSDAINEEDKVAASRIWQKVLGERFPEADPDDNARKGRALRTASPSILGSDGRSA